MPKGLKVGGFEPTTAKRGAASTLIALH